MFVRLLKRITVILLSTAAAVVVVGLVVERLYLSSIVIVEGGSYGFEIGQTREEAYQVAKSLIADGRAVEVHTWPVGEKHRPFLDAENPLTDENRTWKVIVDSDWWNNSVNLSFQNELVIRIRRNRIKWEMP